jgi:hypothetical protein
MRLLNRSLVRLVRSAAICSLALAAAALFAGGNGPGRERPACVSGATECRVALHDGHVVQLVQG